MHCNCITSSSIILFCDYSYHYTTNDYGI